MAVLGGQCGAESDFQGPSGSFFADDLSVSWLQNAAY